jgi:hypothetical protein
MPVKQGAGTEKSGKVFGQGPKTAKTIRAGLYARVSTQDQQTLPCRAGPCASTSGVPRNTRLLKGGEPRSLPLSMTAARETRIRRCSTFTPPRHAVVAAQCGLFFAPALTLWSLLIKKTLQPSNKEQLKLKSSTTPFRPTKF